MQIIKVMFNIGRRNFSLWKQNDPILNSYEHIPYVDNYGQAKNGISFFCGKVCLTVYITTIWCIEKTISDSKLGAGVDRQQDKQRKPFKLCFK